MSADHGWTLSELQQLREHMEMQGRFYQVEREHKMRKLLGDDVYDFIKATEQAGGLRAIIGEPVKNERPDPVLRAHDSISAALECVREIIGETGEAKP